MSSAPNRTARTEALIAVGLFLAALALFASTLAPATLFGDPSEYQFVPAILGIAHPPGYAFYTLLAKAWQVLVPLGTIAYRTNLLAAAVGAWCVTAVYLIVRDIQGREAGLRTVAPAVFAALSLAVAPDLWQHAIHSNAHIVSVGLTLIHLWLLTRWWRSGDDRWLGAFAFTLGLAATHHPITAMGVPAYGLFILAVRPAILRRWRVWLMMLGGGLLGLLPWLYYPLRFRSAPFGPAADWDSLWAHVTARGLRVNLFHFGLADQADRAVAFWSLLRLQYALPVIALMAVGAYALARRRARALLLLAGVMLGHLAFTMNTVQDVMAYLMIPFAALAVLAGAGAWALIERIAPSDRQRAIRRVLGRSSRPSDGATWPVLLTCAVLFLFPIRRAALNLKRGISLRDFTAAEAYVDAVYERFAGRREQAVLLSDWEHLTPLWTHIYAQSEPLNEEDVKLVYVNPTDAATWVANVWQHIEVGPIYLSDYRPSVRNEGFRLVPEPPFYRVVAPPVTKIVPSQLLDIWADDRVHIRGVDLPETTVRAGDPLRLTIYQSVDEPLSEIWMPYGQLGPIEARWTTDSRVLTTQWQPGEIIPEVYEIPVPFHLPPGTYPLRLGYADLINGRPALPLSNGQKTVEVATIEVLPPDRAPARRVLEGALANLDNQVALTDVRARAGWQVRGTPWHEQPLSIQPGQPLHLTLDWRVLRSPRESFTIFIHLLDGAGRPVFGHDYTPVGGAFPSYLWFPKWLPGQSFADPYRLVMPETLSPGTYQLEVGMYGMTSLRRLPVVDLSGNLAGDRVILGSVLVE